MSLLKSGLISFAAAALVGIGVESATPAALGGCDNAASYQHPGLRGQIPQGLPGEGREMRLSRISPERVEPGKTAEIAGVGFGNRQGEKVVLFMRNDFRHQLIAVKWSDRRIRVRVPEAAEAGDYTVGICLDRTCREGSNTVPFSIADQVGGMYIESASVGTSTRRGTVDIRGSRFGKRQGGKVAAINLGRVNRMRVLRWSDRRVVAEIPPGLGLGSYRVLIYYDDTFRTSSNSVELRLGVQPRR